ncbi:hypothetical protein [Lyngbya aestuarii]|uniref:hypothetical protein n=1 Tax=Lyngbya aestuarii TaxID=118322 RepID=UPI00403DE1B9
MSLSTKTAILSLLSAASVCGAGSSQAVVLNGSFETGNFDGWETLGRTYIETLDTYGISPTEGTYQARLDTVYPQSNLGTEDEKTGNFNELLTFLDFEEDILLTLDKGEIFEGSAFKKKLIVEAGDTLSFDWNFLSNASSQKMFNDFAFVTLSTIVNELADSFSAFVSSKSVFNGETGFKSFSYRFETPGVYTLGIGVVDVGDGAEDSGLLVDNFSLLSSGASQEPIDSPTPPNTTNPKPIPEPASGLGLLVFCAFGLGKRLLPR